MNYYEPELLFSITVIGIFIFLDINLVKIKQKQRNLEQEVTDILCCFKIECYQTIFFP